MIAVIGGTGVPGIYVVRGLLEAGQALRCIVRDVDGALEKLGGDVELAVGDVTDSASIEAGCAGCDALFLLTPHNPALGKQQSDAIDAAKRAGVARIVKLAGMMINPEMLIPGQHVVAENHRGKAGSTGPSYGPVSSCRTFSTRRTRSRDRAG